MMLNVDLVYWFSTNPISHETSSFGSEFITIKKCCEYLKCLRYKFLMM